MNHRSRAARSRSCVLRPTLPRLFLEPLEPRRMLSGGPAATVADGTLTIRGTVGGDVISVSTPGNANGLEVTLNGGSAQTFVQSPLTHIRIELGNGDDALTLTGRTLFAEVTIDTGAGDDVISHAIATPDFTTIDAGPGNDSLASTRERRPDSSGPEILFLNSTTLSGSSQIRFHNLEQLDIAPSGVYEMIDLEVNADGLRTAVTVGRRDSYTNVVVHGQSHAPVYLEDPEKDVLRLFAGVLTIDTDLGPTDAYHTVHVSPGSELRFTSSQHLRNLNIAGGKVVLAPGGQNTLVLDQFALERRFGGTLDLNDNSLIVRSAVSPAIAMHIRAARNAASGLWTGPGITSSLARDDLHATLGVGPSQGRGVFAGHEAQAGDTLVRYTRNGDANLDGRVNADDYFRIDWGFLAGPRQPYFHEGDFDYDLSVDADDYHLIDAAFRAGPLSQPTPLSPRDGGLPAPPRMTEPMPPSSPVLPACGAPAIAISWFPCVPGSKDWSISLWRADDHVFAAVGVTVPDQGYHVRWGDVRRDGDAFSFAVDVEDWTGPVAAKRTTFTHVFDLGALPDAVYSFRLDVGGQTVGPKGGYPANITPSPYAPSLAISTHPLIRHNAFATLSYPRNVRVLNWSAPIRDGHNFTFNLAPFTGGVHTRALTTTAHQYDLGLLPDGEYTFTFNIWGKHASTKTITIANYPVPPHLVLGSPGDDVFRVESAPAPYGIRIWWDNAPDPASQPILIDRSQFRLILLDAAGGDDTLLLDDPGLADALVYYGGAGFDRLVILGTNNGASLLVSDDPWNASRPFPASIETTVIRGSRDAQLTVRGGATVILEGSQRFRSINLGDSAQLAIAPGFDQHVSTDALAISDSAVLDVRDNTLAVWPEPGDSPRVIFELTSWITATRLRSPLPALDADYVVTAVRAGSATVRRAYSSPRVRDRILVRAILQEETDPTTA